MEDFLKFCKDTKTKAAEEEGMRNRTNEEIDRVFLVRANGTDAVRFARCQQAKIKQLEHRLRSSEKLREETEEKLREAERVRDQALMVSKYPSKF